MVKARYSGGKLREMTKGKKSIYTAISGFSLTLINGLLGLIVINLIISNYGSDFNGLNSTATQFITMLLLIESGFTLATNVALFRPLADQDYNAINKIMSATKRIFNKIGIVFFLIGIILSIGYTFLIKTDLSNNIVILTFLMTVISTSFNLFYTTKFRILIQTEQKEYILNSIQIFTLIIQQVIIIIVILLEGHMLLVRFVTMVGAIINGLIIAYIFKKSYDFVDFNAIPDYKAIKGTKDVFIQKFTSVLYLSFPIIFISATAGTIYASVFSVYNSIFLMLKNVIYAFINAPQMGFGKLLAENDKNYACKVFIQYEFIAINVLLCLLTTATVLIMPFINIYTKGFVDIDYTNWYIALLLIGITFFEIIHIPSGHIINMSGNFKVARNIQIAASVVLITVMIIGNMIFGFYGILLAVLSTAVLLAVLEINYVYMVFFKRSSLDLLKILLPNFIVSMLLSYFGISLLPTIKGYLEFIIAGFILVILNGSVILIFNLIINRKITIEILNRMRVSIPRKFQTK
ncbi:hypothetical protein [Neobacillus niacini]|uniref:hypothetical protein n=1 Tax=Neobacillus niacini TaxID=86668 RepID=UPI0039834310